MPRVRFHLTAVLCACLLTCGKSRATGSVASDTIPSTARALESPLQQGTLPNGFRFAILPRSNEPGRISLRLIVHAGSLDEHGDEAGYAHFVEHMAFNGTRHYPPGKLPRLFQRLGLTWGADANAETSSTSTIYKLDLPPGHTARLGEALEVLGDYADGIAFDPAEVRRERGVILSEIEARDTDEWQTRLKQISIYYAGTGLPQRLPLGNADSVRRAAAPALRRYYERCYRPERMTLLVVGDVASLPLTQLVGKNFDRLRGHGSAVAQVPPAVVTAPPLDAHVIATASTTAASVSLIAIAPAPDATPAALAADLGGTAVIDLLDRRLAARQAAMPNRIGRAGAFRVQGLDRRYVHWSLEASAAFADWPAALAIIQTELRRARANGFTASEVQEAAAVRLAALRAAETDFGGCTCADLANEIASLLAAGRDWHSPAEIRTLAEAYFAHFTPATAAAGLATILPDEHLDAVVISRLLPEGGPAAVLAAYGANATQPLPVEAASSGATRRFPYEDFGPSGAVATRRAEPALGLERVRFANGARLNLRPSPFEPQRFRLWARLGRGAADVPRDQPGIDLLAVALLSVSDLGRLPREELSRLLRLRAVDGNWTFENNEFIIQLTGPSAALPFALQALTAYLSDAKLDATRLPAAISRFAELAGGFFSSTAGAAKIETMFRATDDDPRFNIPSLSEIRRYSFDTVSSWLHTRWLESPLEIGLAGDFKTDDAIAAAAASIGTLPTRHEVPLDAAEKWGFRAKAYRNLSLLDVPDETADVRVFWPIPHASDLRTLRSLRLGLSALEDELRLKLRQELGVTYSPSSGVYRELAQPDFGLALVELTFPPANAAKLAERTIQLADELARRGLTKDEFDHLREPLRAAALADLRSNPWWLANVLLHAQTQPAVLAEARTHGIAYDDLTRAEVNRALATHLRATTASCVGFIPQAPPVPAKAKP